MPTNPLSLDDRGHRRVFAMLSLLAAGDPSPRAELLRRAERLVPLTDREEARAPEGRRSEARSQERRNVDRELTRAYETLRARRVLVDPPQNGSWALTEEGRRMVAEAAGSHRDFFGLGQGAAADVDESLGEEACDEVSYPDPHPRGSTVPLNQILYGPPGTGKTYSTVDAALMALGDPAAPSDVGAARTEAERTRQLDAYRDHVKAGRIEFVTFHQAFSYEDFVEGYRPVISPRGSEGNGDITYRVEHGVLRKIVHRARLAPGETFVLVIDEINRGNVAGIFGELITLIEDGKRIGQTEAVEVRLPYSGDSFGVPVNVHIIGTMNTADRSLAGVDLALRRRFDFVEMLPRPEMLASVVVEGVDVTKLLRGLNERIQSAKGREFAVGHAFFMPLVGQSQPPTLRDLRSVFERKVIPLLQEYFFEDDQQIADVLGQKRGTGRAGLNTDYLRPRRETPVVNGQVIWDAVPEVLESVGFYQQVAGREVEPVTNQTPAPTQGPPSPAGAGEEFVERLHVGEGNGASAVLGDGT